MSSKEEKQALTGCHRIKQEGLSQLLKLPILYTPMGIVAKDARIPEVALLPYSCVCSWWLSTHMVVCIVVYYISAHTQWCTLTTHVNIFCFLSHMPCMIRERYLVPTAVCDVLAMFANRVPSACATKAVSLATQVFETQAFFLTSTVRIWGQSSRDSWTWCTCKAFKAVRVSLPLLSVHAAWHWC